MSADGIHMRIIVLEMERRMINQIDTLWDDISSKILSIEKSCSNISSDFSTMWSVSLGIESGKRTGKLEEQRLIDSKVFIFDAILTDSAIQSVLQRCVLDKNTPFVFNSEV